MDNKQERKAQGEALQIASQMKKSGYPYFCAQLNECMGDEKVLASCLEMMNKESEGKKRLGNTKDIAKLLVSSNDEYLTAFVYIPESSGGNIASKELEFLKEAVGKEMNESNKDDLVYSTRDNGITGVKIVNNPDKNIYVFKLRDEIISRGNAYLREKKLIPSPEDDSDDELYGDEVFDAM